MKYLSVCSGIEAVTVAWHPLGWQPVAFSEIEPFPSAVLAHHYPAVPNLGDMTKFKEWNCYDIDVLVGGTPCQSFSVAGLRKGLDDPRGNLMLTYLAIADQYRPRWLVWENVPGVLSSNAGKDFGTFLGGLGELGYGFAYRVLDAQYFGVAQRRRRVFVVGYLGDWRRAAAVLFERHSLQGHPAPSRQAGKAAPTIPSRSSAGGCLGTDFDLDGGLVTGGQQTAACLTTKTRIDAETETLIPTFGGGFDVAHSLRGEGFDASEDETGRGTPLVPVAAMHETGQGFWKSGDVAGTLRAEGENRPSRPSNVVAYTMDVNKSANEHSSQGVQIEHSNTLRTEKVPAVIRGMSVRRLTPRECERLQGFPDDYTFIPWRTWQESQRKGISYESLLTQRGMTLRGPSIEECSDGPRYKALGNSMAVPVMAWIGQRIQTVADLHTSTKQAA